MHCKKIFRTIVRHQRTRIRNRKNQALEAHTESEAFSRWTVEFFGQAIIPATANYSVLGAKAAGRNLECRSDVVVQPANKLRVYAKMDIPLGQIRLKFFKVAAATITQSVRNRRQFGDHRLARRNFAIEYA